MSFRPRVIRSVAWRLTVSAVALATAVFVGGRLMSAQAQSIRTWDGGGTDNNWSTAGNWSADDAPDGTAEAALFTDDPIGQTKLTPNLSADVTIGQLQFSATAPSYTISGTGPSQLFLSPSASFGGIGVSVASGAANQSITAAEVEFLSSQTWDIGGTTTLTVTGTIEDDSVIDYGLTKNGTGTLVFPGDVRYDGATSVNAGSLILSFSNTSMLSALTVNGGLLRATTSANALGNSSTRNTITLAGGALELANNTGLTFGSTSRITNVTGNATIRSDRLTAGAGVTHRLGTLRIGAQTLSVTAGTNATSGTAGTTFGATTLLGNATLGVVNSGSAGAQLTLGAVSQSGGTRSLTKSGNGTLRLNGAGSYTGGTTLGQGAVTLGIANALGSGGFNFAGGTLNGNNFTDSSIGALALTANSTLNLSTGGAAATLTFAGVSGTANGILTITGWSGTPGGLGTNDKIIFSGGTTPSADFLQHIRFDLGGGNIYSGALGTGGELIPSAPFGTITFSGSEHLGNPTDTSIAINVVPAASATIYYEYGTASGVYTLQTPPMAAPANQPSEVVLTGLQPNTHYFYRMRYEAAANPGTWVARNEYQFQTDRPAGSTYQFVITSDSHVNLQLGTLSQWQTALDMIAAERPDFMIDLGDTFAMDNGTTAVTSEAAADQVYLFQRGASVLGRASHSVPMFLAMGNHENEEGWNFNDVNPQPIWGMKARKRYFPLPSPLTAPGFYSANTDPVEANDVTPPNSHIIGSDQFREDYYAWTWGDALFVVFDPFQYTMQNPYGASAGEGSDDPAVGDRWNWTMGIQQHQWLHNVLSTSTAKYKFLFAHHMLGGTENYVRGGAEPSHMFEWGGYNADGTTWGWDTQRPAAVGWIEPVRQMMIDYGVTAFFHGHDHQFAYELRDGIVYQEVPAPSQGTTSGFGSYNTSPYLVNQSSNSGYLRVTLSPSQALVEYVKTTGTNVGQVQYSYTMAPRTGPSYVISASAGANGSISPSGTVNIAQGGNQSVVFTPNSGFVVADVVVDGSSVGAVPNYQFTNVTANHTIAVTFTPQTVTVPSVVGLTQSAAATAFGSIGLVVGTITSAPHASVPIGSVILQSPLAGSTALLGTAIDLTISTGVLVPDVSGQTQSLATSTLTSAGFLVTSSTQASTSVQSGSVISQSPAGGASASGGSTVALVISSGAPTNITVANPQSMPNTTSGNSVDLTYTVPNINGLSLLLVVYGGAEASTTNLALPTGATFHGAAMNVAAQHRTPATGINAGSGLYWLPVSPNESGTIHLTFTGTCDERAVGAVTLVGAASTGPEVVEVATATAAITDQITTLSTNAMVVSTATQGNNGPLTATGTGHVLDVSAALASSLMAGGHAEVAAPSTQTFGFSGTINRVAMILASFPVSAPQLPPVTVPNVTNILQASAQSTLTGVGLQAVIATAYSDTVSAGYVISQTPLAGASVPSGTNVNLLVSLGPAPSNTPPGVVLTAPANQATGLATSTMLTASVIDTDATTVTFYGRKTAPAVPGPDFVIATLPDTQYYSQNTGGNRAQTFYTQTQWYAAQREPLNIAFISHMGDMVQSNDNGTNNSEWIIADTAMTTIESQSATGLPYGIPWGGAPGNHDQTTNGQVNAPNVKWNTFFGAGRWAGRPYFGGSFSQTNNSNNYELFEASGIEFLIIHLDYTTAAGVNQNVINWADALMKAYPNRRAIVTSHWILDLPPTSPIGASAPFGGPGQRFFDEFKDNPNFFLMLSGHQHGEGRRADVFNGRTINSVLQDYQERANGGDGWLRYFIFSPANNTITAKTYSPTLNQSETDTDATSSPRNQASEFVLPYDMQSAVAPWSVLGTVNVPAGGGAAQFNWTGLEEGSTYEWYVGATDGLATTTSAVRIFSTSDNVAPSVSLTFPANNAVFTTPVDITLTASASDSDGSITNVEFFDGTTKLGEAATSPYSMIWTNAPAGSHSLTARATDDDNAASTSTPIAITVNVPPPVPSLSVNDVTVGEGAGTATFTVTLSAASSQTVTVQYATAPGTASTSDYTTASGTVTFTPGQTTQPIVVSLVNDILVESAETFTVGLSSPTNATILDGSGQATITDDDVAPSLSVNDVTVGEGAGTATFTVTLSAASSQTVTVQYATAPGTASTSDYTTTSGTVTFTPGQTTQPIVVSLVNDILVESAETFTVGLSNPTNASINDGSGQATITDDDTAGGTPVTITVQIAAGGDDVNQDGTALATGVSGVWLGTASSTTSSYAGLRFVNLTVPRNATVTSARLEVNSAATQWQTMAFEYAVEAAGNSAAFATSSLPGSRTLLTPRVTHSSNVQWTANTWYQLEQIAPLVQALVQRADWASGNALSLILRGTGSAWGRKFGKSYEAGAATAPRLVITYTTP